MEDTTIAKPNSMLDSGRLEVIILVVAQVNTIDAAFA